MKLSPAKFWIVFALILSVANSATSAQTSPPDSKEIVEEAYIYLYPLVLMDITRLQLTNLDPKQSPIAGAPNEFTHVRAFPTADLRVVVRPNFDTLYSSAWLDLTEGPVVVSHEDTHGRYFMLPMLDMWSDVFAVPGKRTSGTEPRNFAVVPPGWNGQLPAGVERIDSPTTMVWVIGRTQTNGTRDYPAVHAIQDGYRITHLEDWGKAPRKRAHKIDPTVDTKTEPMRQVAQMSPSKFFEHAARLMELNPPHASDWSTVSRLKRIGISPGRYTPTVSDAELKAGVESAQQLLREKLPTIARVTNGWQMNTDTMGVYGNYYLKRAIVAMVGLGANQVEDAIYPLNIADADGNPVMAENNYVLHFAKEELPPVSAFWSLTLYDDEGYQVANPLNRFAIGDRDALKFNGDGSLDLFIQHESPGAERESNWLPAPKSGRLGLTLRLYAPSGAVSRGDWNPPAVQRSK